MELKLRNLSTWSTVVLASAVTVIVLLSLTVEPVSSIPTISHGWSEYHRRFGITSDPKRIANSECDNSSVEVRQLCQRCAKVTKSKLAYPMCCDNREQVRDWCRELLMVG